MVVVAYKALKPLETTPLDTVLFNRTTSYFVMFVFVLRQCSQKMKNWLKNWLFLNAFTLDFAFLVSLRKEKRERTSRLFSLRKA